MVREEILTGLKNAVERGQSIEKAVQSMISAGYNPTEVNEAVSYINLGSIGEITKQEIREKSGLSSFPETAEPESPYKPLPTSDIPLVNEKPKNKLPHWIILALIFVGALILFILLFSLFGEKILSALFGKAG
jgi:hypothetical protein